MKKLINISLGLVILSMMSSCASTYIKSGHEAHENFYYADAIRSYEKGLNKKQDADAYRNLADSYMRINKFDSAVSTFDKLIAMPGHGSVDQINFGRALMSKKQYTKAADVLGAVPAGDSLYDAAQNLLYSCNNIELMMRDSFLHPVKDIYIPEMSSAFSPVQFDGGLLVTSIKDGGAKDPYTKESFTDLYFVKNDGGTWSLPRKVGGLNGKYHDGVPTISKDGKTMVYTRSNYKGLKGLDKNQDYVNTMQLYESTKNDEGEWSDPKEIELNNDEFMFAHPTLSSDGKTMYFSSNMKGGQGGMDIWKVEKSNDKWGTPVNLGSTINTSGDEVFPSLKDNGELYFSSDSHKSLGGLDLLKSSNEGGSWSQPESLPYPLNSPADDFGITFSDEDTGYLSSDRSGSDKIYSYINYDPTITTLISLKDDIKFEPITGMMVIIENLTDGTSEEIMTDSEGNIEYNLLPGKEYKITAGSNQYEIGTENISTLGLLEDTTISKTLNLKKKEDAIVDGGGDGNGGNGGNGGNSGNGGNGGDGLFTFIPGKAGSGRYVIPNILWDYDQWNVRSDAEQYLNDLASLLKDNSGLDVTIESHCDERGSNTYNDRLSKKRAKAVVDYLVSKGVPKKMLKSKGMGKRQLEYKCDENCTDAQHQANRRTEFTVIRPEQ